MCGISGFYSFNNIFSEQELHEMTNAIAHRGSDAFGYYTDKTVGMGHRRLSIIDLSTNANQPMHSANGRYVMVYNGEVYNYQEIASELKQKSTIDFKTSSDSEVILEAYVQLGSAAIEKFNGMFAIAIYDKEKKELFVCRDRIGIKPLYYFWDGENFAFASELKALTKLSAIPLEINNNAIYHFLHLGFVPAPQSIYKSINKLEAGTWLKISNKNSESHKYWTINKQITDETISNKKEALTKLSDLILSSVQYQIRSDVPFGVFLSGGIDSSLVTASAVNLSGVKVNTFSIGFEENKYNESIYAKAVANYLGTNHHEFIVTYKDAIDLIDTVFDTYSEPFADPSCIPTMLVSKLAKQHVTVTLSGEGGDELFLGYGAYQWAKRLNHPLIKAFRNPIAKLLSNSNSKFERHANYFRYPNENLKYSHIHSQEQYYFSLSELESLFTNEFSETKNNLNTERLNNFWIEINHLGRNLTAMEKQAIFDLNFYLQDDLLTKVDRASMHFSLETRVPYLDHRIIEFALNLSPELKYKNGTTKYLLKEILFQYVPKKFFDRPKQGFAIPLQKWLKNELRFLIEENLSKEVIEKFGYVNFASVEKLKKEFLNGKDYYYNRIWILIVLHKWLQANVQ
ncbi:MAG: asparagine synthase (glutamine-hydrolyzing) [Bacteroidetes bacterium RIFCSPLOWO2_12_FULL_35_15]|nr:MAG: asparagine synthase (glutamine-hydrolyzing) [Bacteroidetes bacterium RIFCSPLOWO2_12_FULL_35_15]